MSEETKATCGKQLSAKELLRNKGICSEAWKDWDESSCALPKIGAHKRFEPDGSWLEGKQIEKGLASREFLLGVERVERSSQLSTAEWLSSEKRAKVTKKIGSEWSNFGHEVNANLYLIAEEALLLLETECLELFWEGTPLSIQQAYDILIESEDSDCSLDEYRVYSQLTRLGYRLQRFYYEKSQLERSSGPDEQIQRKKVIVDPEKGLWMTGNNSETSESSGNRQKPEIDNDIREIVEHMVVSVNGNDDNPKNDASQRTAESKDSENKSTERKTKNSKVEIIFEQTILSPVRIVKEGNPEQGVSKWPGSRIQRNVKLLPKRNDKLPSSGTSAETGSGKSTHDIAERTLDKRKQTQSGANSPEAKKSKHEVIELSDDEIEEIPRPMSRMDMLNCLPNIANQTFVTENISKRYIPRSVRPQSTYRYDSRKLMQLSENDKKQRTTAESNRNGSKSTVDNNFTNQRAVAIPYQRYSNQQRFQSSPRYNYSNNNYSNNNYSNNNYSNNFNRPSMHSINQYSSNSTMMNVPGGGICFQQQQISINSRQVANRWSSYQVNMFRHSGILGYAMRNVFMQNFYMAHCQNQNMAMAAQQQFNRPRRSFDRYSQASHSSRAPSTSQQSNDNDERDTINDESRDVSDEQYDKSCFEGTFKNIPGTSSWLDLKQKWRDVKTITIDDEEDCNDIQVVEENVKPLVSAKTTQSMAEIYEKLRIIKSAPDRTVRRKKCDLKISYNVYSSTQHYRKGNPGMPMFHLVVTSRKESVYLQPVELNRLQQDGQGASIVFAHVSNSSIAFIQPGIINLPNLV